MKLHCYIAIAPLLAAEPSLLGDSIFMDPAGPQQIEEQETELKNEQTVEKGFYQQGNCVSPVFTSSRRNELIPPTPAFTNPDQCEGKLVLKHNHFNSRDPSLADTIASAKSGVVVEVIKGDEKTRVHPDGKVERWNEKQQKYEPVDNFSAGTERQIRNAINVLKDPNSGNLHESGTFKELIAAVANCTGEVADLAKEFCLTEELNKALQDKSSVERKEPVPSATSAKAGAQQVKAKAEKKKSEKKEKATKKSEKGKAEKQSPVAVEKNGQVSPTPQPAPAPAATVADTTLPTISLPIATSHVCTDFEFVRDQKAGDVMWHKVYRCTECGREKSVNVKNGEAIDDVIADNKERQQLENQTRQAAAQAIEKSGATIKWSDYLTDD